MVNRAKSLPTANKYFSLLIFMMVLTCCAEAFQKDLPSLFDSLESAWDPGKKYTGADNSQGLLAWNASYVLDSYLDMFLATGKVAYLEKFEILGNAILELTDEKKGFVDFQGKSLPGWGATKYSKNGERIIWLVHSGMLTYPLLRFCIIVQDSTWTRFKPSRKVFLDFSQRALSVFDRDWVEDRNGQGYFRFVKSAPASDNSLFPPMPLPFNQQLAAGRSLILLYQLTGKRKYLEKVEGLAKHFHDRLKKGPDGSVSWRYWYGKGILAYPAMEDVSHGAIDIGFAVAAYRAGVVFKIDEMQSFVNTFLMHIVKNNGFSKRVDGTGEERWDLACLWLELASFDSKIKVACEEALSKSEPTPEAYTFSVYAKLLKYSRTEMGLKQ